MGKSKGPPSYSHLPAGVLADTKALMLLLGVGPTEWDVLLVGDGSGTEWNHACGWASVLVDQRLALRKEFHGAMNAGTSYLAEVLPYVQALLWYSEGPGKVRLYEKASKSGKGLDIHILTDNETVAAQGAKGKVRKKGSPYWAMLDTFADQGYMLHWHWMKRNESGLNKLCDYLAGVCRVSIETISPIAPPAGTSIYDFNPDSV